MTELEKIGMEKLRSQVQTAMDRILEREPTDEQSIDGLKHLIYFLKSDLNKSLLTIRALCPND